MCTSQVKLILCFLCVNGAEHAVKLHGKCDEAHTDLTRHRGMSPVTTSAELYHVYRTWEFPRRCTSQRSAGASAMRNLDYIHPWNIAWSSFRYARGFISPLQPEQSCITFITHGSPHAAAPHRQQRSAGASAMHNLDCIHPWDIAWSSFRCARGGLRPKH